jgi:secreted trypsin-like serine protease
MPSAPIDPALLVMGIVYSDTGYGNYEICSGTLVDSTHVLTAGHCGCGNPTSYRIYSTDSVYPPGKSDISMGLGPSYYPSKPPVMYDPRLCGSAQFRGNDLALLELAKGSLPAPAMNFGNPLWTLLQELNKGERLLTVGYGFNNKNTIGFRYRDNIPIMSVACTERALAPYCTPYAEMILAEASGPGMRDDSCGGDSGGPVFNFANEGYALVAVTSRSAPGIQDNPGKNCGGGGIYTILGRDSVQQWLKVNGVQPAPWLKIGSPW